MPSDTTGEGVAAAGVTPPFTEIELLLPASASIDKVLSGDLVGAEKVRRVSYSVKRTFVYTGSRACAGGVPARDPS